MEFWVSEEDDSRVVLSRDGPAGPYRIYVPGEGLVDVPYVVTCFWDDPIRSVSEEEALEYMRMGYGPSGESLRWLRGPRETLPVDLSV